MFVEEEDEFVQIAGGAHPQIGSPGLKQHISQGQYQPAIRDPRLQLLDLSLQLRGLLLRVRGGYARRIRLTAGLVSRQLLRAPFGSSARDLPVSRQLLLGTFGSGARDLPVSRQPLLGTFGSGRRDPPVRRPPPLGTF